MQDTFTTNSFKGLTVGNSFAFLDESDKVISDFTILQIEVTTKHNRVIDCQFFYSDNGICKQVDSKQVFFSGYFCGTYGLELTMTLEEAESCSHSGRCDEDVKFLSQNKRILEQWEKIDKEQVKKALQESGAWEESELQDNSENLLKAVWLAANDISEQE